MRSIIILILAALALPLAGFAEHKQKKLTSQMIKTMVEYKLIQDKISKDDIICGNLTKYFLIKGTSAHEIAAKAYVSRASRRAQFCSGAVPNNFLMIILDLSAGLPSKEKLWIEIEKHNKFARKVSKPSKMKIDELNKVLWLLILREHGLSIKEISEIIYSHSTDPSGRRSDVKKRLKTAYKN